MTLGLRVEGHRWQQVTPGGLVSSVKWIKLSLGSVSGDKEGGLSQQYIEWSPKFSKHTLVTGIMCVITEASRRISQKGGQRIGGQL